MGLTQLRSYRRVQSIYLPTKVACQALDRAFGTMTSLDSQPIRLSADRELCEQFRGRPKA